MSNLRNNPSLSVTVRILSFVPAILLLCLIFGFSAQTGEESGSLSYRISLEIVRTADLLLPFQLSEAETFTCADSIHLLVRKAAHMTEYFLLALFIYLPVYANLSFRRITLRDRLLLTLAVTVTCAALDEFHQTFVSGRAGTILDVGIDSIGIVIACTILYFAGHSRSAGESHPPTSHPSEPPVR
ncbi:MAG: VanZ family protein [Lachnospiraceae bacterium]